MLFLTGWKGRHDLPFICSLEHASNLMVVAGNGAFDILGTYSSIRAIRNSVLCLPLIGLEWRVGPSHERPIDSLLG